MGGGSYSYTRDLGTKLHNSSMSREEVFRQRQMNPEMNIKGKIRECRDSEEHHETLPIIIGLDVTGSMGAIPHRLVTQDFPDIMKKIMDAGIAHPQVCFIGIGDHECDSAPLQVGQFEASDELLDTWLRKLYIEGGGGGNAGESYLLAWWFAARHTDIDSFAKRGQKGVLITIGDEPTLRSISKRDCDSIFGTSPQTPQITASQMLKEAQVMWNVYHVNVMDYAGVRSITQESWQEYLGDNLVNTQTSSGTDVADIIAGIIIAASKSMQPTASSTPVNEVDRDNTPDPATHLR